MSQFDNIVFGKKKFSDILEEIYNNQQKKDKQVTALINELKPLISEIGDATLVVPLIKEYMEIINRNKTLLFIPIDVFSNYIPSVVVHKFNFRNKFHF